MNTVLSIVAASLLAGCGASTTALSDSVRLMVKAPEADTAQLNPNLRYLRVTVNKNVALMVLGYVDTTPQPGTQVWYSAEKETLRLWNGRLAGTAGLATDWRSVRFGEVPSWRAALAGNTRYQRQRDVMPGYQVDTRDEVTIVPVAPPRNSALVGMPAGRLQWFEERTAAQGHVPGLPAALFAVDLSGQGEPVVYSEQCLSPSLCITLQAWPAAVPAPSPTPAAL